MPGLARTRRRSSRPRSRSTRSTASTSATARAPATRSSSCRSSSTSRRSRSARSRSASCATRPRRSAGLEVTTVIAAKLGDAVGLQIGGAGVTIALDGPESPAAMFPWDVSPRWPDAIGLRVNAGPIKGGGYIERKVRTYGERRQQAGARRVRRRHPARDPQGRRLRDRHPQPGPVLARARHGRPLPDRDRAQLRLHVQRRRRHPRAQPPGRHAAS